MADGDDEFAAFQAEMSKLDAPAATNIGPRAPQVISAAPSGPATVTTTSRAPLPAGTATMGGARVPVSQWPTPADLVSRIQQDYPRAVMPELGMTPGAAAAAAAAERVAAEQAAANGAAYAPPGGGHLHQLGAMVPAASSTSVAAALSMGRLAAGQMPGDGTVRLPGETPRVKSEKPFGAPAGSSALGPPGGGGSTALGKRKAEDGPNLTKRSVAGKSWVDNTLADWPEDDFRIFVGDLGNETNDDVLAHAFSKYPSFQKAKVIRNKQSQKSMGYGFVSFKDPWDMTKALREMVGKYIGNRPVKVRKSTWKERAGDGADTEWMGASLAVNDKSLAKGLGNKKKFPPKKKKGMPW